MPVKKYCGNSETLPDGYDEFATIFECMKRGFGVCKYSGKLGYKHAESIPLDPDRPKIYCGTKDILPPGYARFGERNECLRRGFGRCLYTVPTPDFLQEEQSTVGQLPDQQDLPGLQEEQDIFVASFIEKYIERRFTQKEWQKIFNKLSQQQKDWVNQNLIFTQGEMHGFYKIEPF